MTGQLGFPVLWQHDPSKSVGRYHNGVMYLNPRTITVDMLLNAGFGIRVLEEEWHDDKRYAVRVEVLELSPPVQPVVYRDVLLRYLKEERRLLRQGFKVIMSDEVLEKLADELCQEGPHGDAG